MNEFLFKLKLLGFSALAIFVVLLIIFILLVIANYWLHYPYGRERKKSKWNRKL